jgi:hypothetical protein
MSRSGEKSDQDAERGNLDPPYSAGGRRHSGTLHLSASTAHADVLFQILTETKRNNMGAIPEDKAFKALYPFQYWANSSQKGYAGEFYAPLSSPLVSPC